jgi:hypothetical protein
MKYGLLGLRLFSMLMLCYVLVSSSFLSKREHKYLSYVINLRNISASFILLNAPAELQAKLHYAV